MAPKDLLLIIVERWSKVWREVVASTIAAILAWIIARQIFGHTHPIFASVIAIVCLAPGIPNHSKQAWSLVLGVATGILVGEIALMLPNPVLRMGFGLFVSMMAASSFGLGPILPIQAGVSALLVLTLGPETAGYVRMTDVVIGTVIGLICGKFLPVRTKSPPVT
jgi:uncharacterized membrane protein YgaE (UPF0421/DUF939 family)